RRAAPGRGLRPPHRPHRPRRPRRHRRHLPRPRRPPPGAPDRALHRQQGEPDGDPRPRAAHARRAQARPARLPAPEQGRRAPRARRGFGLSPLAMARTIVSVLTFGAFATLALPFARLLGRRKRSKVDTAQWTPELLKQIERRRFEQLCAAYFEALGLRADVVPAGPGGGVDINLYQ